MRKVIDIPIWYEKNRIVKLRKDYGFNQTEVANKIGCVLKTYQNYEQGHNFPTLEYATNLADLYKVSIDYLLGKSDYTYVENEEIGKITGLSDDAIETLKSLKNVYDFDKDMKIFNYIMSDRQLFSLFLSDLRNYIEPGYNVPIHPVQDEKTKNIKYVANIDIESDSILANTERRLYVGKENGEFNGEPLYDIMGIPISSLDSLSILQIQEILQTWKKNYKKE